MKSKTKNFWVTLSRKELRLLSTALGEAVAARFEVGDLPSDPERAPMLKLMQQVDEVLYAPKKNKSK